MRGLLFFLLLSVAGSAFADATVPTKDIAGAKDPAWLKRYEGSFIVSYDHRGFDAVAFPASRLIKSEDDDERDAKNNSVFRAKNLLKAEGEYTRLVYIAPEDRSPLEIMRNYIDVIKEAGGKSRYGCQDQACGGEMQATTMAAASRA